MAIANAISKWSKEVLAIIKGYILDELPQRISPYYEDYLQPNTKPDRKTKSGRLYYTEPNDTKKLRTLYGNIQRAIEYNPNQDDGAIFEVLTTGDRVFVNSGIDYDHEVQAGPDRTTLRYAEIHETGDRPFLDPGFKDFQEKEMPKVMVQISNEVLRFYNGL